MVVRRHGFSSRIQQALCLVSAMTLSSELAAQLVDPSELVPEQPEVPLAPGALPDKVLLPKVTEAKAPALAAKEGTTKYEGFIVVGSYQKIRGGVASIAGNLQNEFSKHIGERGDRVQLPIIIQLYGQEGDDELEQSIVSEIELFEGQYQLKIHIHLAKGVDHQRLRYHVMKMLLYERGLREGRKVEEGERVIVKPWLILGMLEALDLKSGKANRKIYQAEITYFEILPLDSVFDASESEWQRMDGRKPSVFKAISGSMVNALLRQPNGRRGMGGYLKEVATFKGEVGNLMRKHFPSMNTSRNSLEKWVDLEMAELSTAIVSQVFSILETEKQLDSSLQLRYRDPQGAAASVGIEAYAEVIKLDIAKRVAAVAGARADIERLSYRSFPSYRPLINEYEMVLRDVILAKDKDIQIRLDKLSEVRMKLKDAGTQARDYMDWFYITRSNDVSGDVKRYRELKQALEQERMKSTQDDAVDSYLDKVQTIYGAGS